MSLPVILTQRVSGVLVGGDPIHGVFAGQPRACGQDDRARDQAESGLRLIANALSV